MTNRETFSPVGQILVKIFFSEAKITRFEKTSFELTVAEIFPKTKLYYLTEDSNSGKNKTSIFYILSMFIPPWSKYMRACIGVKGIKTGVVMFLS